MLDNFDVHSSKGSFLIDNSSFSDSAASVGGLAYSFNSHIICTGSTFFVDNFGSLYAFSCNITFNGFTKFENSLETSNNLPFLEEGGAITSILSSITFAGTSNLINNQGTYGGAVLAIESTITVYGYTVIVNNTATADGGGLSLRQSSLETKGEQLNSYISHNNAIRGGGIHAIDSTIIINHPGALHVVSNDAEL